MWWYKYFMGWKMECSIQQGEAKCCHFQRLINLFIQENSEPVLLNDIFQAHDAGRIYLFLCTRKHFFKIIIKWKWLLNVLRYGGIHHLVNKNALGHEDATGQFDFVHFNVVPTVACHRHACFVLKWVALSLKLRVFSNV